MAKHPFQGITSIKPRQELSGERLAREENQQLSRTYITQRNRRLALSIQKEEVELAEKRGSLVSLKLAQRQATFLVIAMRQKLLFLPGRVAHKVASETSLHKCQQILQAEIFEILEELRQLPESIQPGWLGKMKEEEKES